MEIVQEKYINFSKFATAQFKLLGREMPADVGAILAAPVAAVLQNLKIMITAGYSLEAVKSGFSSQLGIKLEDLTAENQKILGRYAEYFYKVASTL